jgi:hypothetical protein
LASFCEPRGCHRPAGLGRAHDEARFGRCGARQRKAQLALARPHHVVDGEDPAWLQDPAGLGEQRRHFFDVHADVQHVGAVERSGRERQRQGAGRPAASPITVLAPAL